MQNNELATYNGQVVTVTIEAPVMRDATGQSIPRGGTYRTEISEVTGRISVGRNGITVFDAHTGRMIVSTMGAYVAKVTR